MKYPKSLLRGAAQVLPPVHSEDMQYKKVLAGREISVGWGVARADLQGSHWLAAAAHGVEVKD